MGMGPVSCENCSVFKKGEGGPEAPGALRLRNKGSLSPEALFLRKAKAIWSRCEPCFLRKLIYIYTQEVLFLRNYKGDFGPDLFWKEEKTALRRGHKEGRCNSLTQRACLQKEPARYMKTQADTGLGPVPCGNSFVFKKAKAISTGPIT